MLNKYTQLWWIKSWFQTKISHVRDSEDKIAVLPTEVAQWGVCQVQFTKAINPEAKIRCLTCCRYDCLHTTALTFRLHQAPDDDSPLAIFKHSMENIPDRIDQTNNAYSDKKIQLYPGSIINITVYILHTCIHLFFGSFIYVFFSEFFNLLRTVALESRYTLEWLPLYSMLMLFLINGYNCIVIAHIIETIPAFYHWGCLLSAKTSTSNLHQGILNRIGVIILQK